jgi:signal peptidase I
MTSDANREPSAKPAEANEWVEIIKTIVYALLIALVLRVLLFQPFTIPSASMEPNLFEGDYIIVSKYNYGYSRHSFPISLPESWLGGRVFAHQPTRGDIVVFKLPRDNKTDYIKRLIGLPGDRIQVKQGLIYINDKPIVRKRMPDGTEDMGYGVRPVERFQETLPNGVTYMTNSYGDNQDVDNTDVYVVPEGHYFMMGDNRDNSQDSRYWGFVPDENIVGKAFFVWMNFGDLKRIGSFK